MRKRKDSFLSSINNKKVKGRRSGKKSPAFSFFQDKIYFFIIEKTVVGGFVCNILGQFSSKLEG